MERRLLCQEMHPDLGIKAEKFVMVSHSADCFHFPSGRDWRQEPQPSSRAVKILDMLGVAWRADIERDRPADTDTGERPAMPFGWPAIDSALTGALDNLQRLDRAISALGEDVGTERDLDDDMPGYRALDDARDDALTRLAEHRAESRLGLQAKAKALLTRNLSELHGEDYAAVAASLARDLLHVTPRRFEAQPDPIFPAIAECKRLEAETEAAEAALAPDRDTPEDAGAAVMAHLHDVLLKTVPTSAEGCKALARFLPAFLERWGASMEKDAPTAFALIARSPLL